MNKCLLVTLLTMLLSSIGLFAQNLLTNPGFETWGTGRQPVTDWMITNTANGTVTQDATHIEGSKSCLMYATGSFYELYQQNIAVVPGKTYNVSVSYYVKNGDGTDAQVWCYFQNASGAAIPLSLDDSLKLKGPNGATSFFPNNKNIWNTYTCSVIAPVNATTFHFGVRTYKAGQVCWDNFSFAEDLTPVINKSVSALSGFSYYETSGPSSDKAFTVSGSNLSSALHITVPSNFEISTSSGASFTGLSSLTLAQTGGTVAPFTLYARLKSGLPVGSYSGNLVLSTTGVANGIIKLSGDVISAPPTITVSAASVTGLTYVDGSGPSAAKYVTVSGTYLKSSVTVTAPDNYEISVNSGVSYSKSAVLDQTSGKLASTKLYIRLISGLAVDSYTGNVVLSTAGGPDKTIALSGTVTSKPGLYVSSSAITGLDYNLNGGPSNIQSFNIYGSSLASFVNVYAPDSYFEISTDGGSSFMAVPLTIASPVNGALNIPVYVRLSGELPMGVYTNTVTIVSSGLPTLKVVLTGEVKLTSALNQSGSDAMNVFAQSGNVVVDGAQLNDRVQVYSLMGRLIHSVVATSNRVSLPVAPGAVYIVKVNAQTFKVLM